MKITKKGNKKFVISGVVDDGDGYAADFVSKLREGTSWRMVNAGIGGAAHSYFPPDDLWKIAIGSENTTITISVDEARYESLRVSSNLRKSFVRKFWVTDQHDWIRMAYKQTKNAFKSLGYRVRG